jgi:hypothetical protein
MDRPSAPDRWDQLADQPWDVQITVVRAPPGRVARARIAGIPIPTAARGLVALIVILAGVGAVVLGAPSARHAGALGPGLAVGSRPTESPTAAAYRYPLGCMGAALSMTSRVSVDEARPANPCWRYGVYVTAILRQVRGVWRLELEAVSASCPAVSLPAVVRAQLAVCRKARRPK